MLYIVAIFVGIVFGVIKKGKILNILNVRIDKIWIFLLACIISIVANSLSKNMHPGVILSILSWAVQGLTVLLLVLGLWFNRRFIGLWVVGAGIAANSIVMLANNGKMPVSAEAVRSVGGVISSSTLDLKHVIADTGTRLYFLADIITPPGFLGLLMRVISVGDIVISIGLMVLAYQLTKINGAAKNEK